MTNVTAVAYGDMPLFLFHLIEFADVEYEIDVAALNEAWAHPGAVDEWSQFILKQTDDDVELITACAALRCLASRSEGARRNPLRPPRDRLAHRRRARTRPSTSASPAEGQFRYPGADLGILVTTRPSADRRPRAHRAALALDLGDQGAVPGRPTSARDAAPAARALLLQDAVSLELTFEAVEEAAAGRASGRRSSITTGRATARGSCTRANERVRVYAESARMLREHMPELVPTWRAAVRARGRRRPRGPDALDVAASLVPLRAARRASGRAASPMLVRNYDYPPLFSGAYRWGMGTLYTAVYDVVRGAVEYRWPGYTWKQSFDRFRTGIRVVSLVQSTAA